ncbi:MAG: hypothetical protein B7Y80_20100 [Hyphomicrobium sp. 32-62-53]|nr:MAG: hypothetical protein B7Z29_19930 [Hyphomicrobium sp. 12-62-95]OYX97336.1 MAG: hypothetical protein B7Y80_20100 [Hyphomicrobium sp. 32-62-53]
MTAPSKLDAGRLTHVADLAAEKLSVARATFEAMRELADALKAARAAVGVAEQDLYRALPSQRGYFENALAKARAALETAEAAFKAANAKYENATAASETAGRLHAACREYAIQQGLIAHPQGGLIQKEAVA